MVADSAAAVTAAAAATMTVAAADANLLSFITAN